VAIGAVLGLFLALGAARTIGSMLYGLEAIDPVSLAAATFILIAVSAVAAYIPARRAGRMDPLVALRSE
jgi:putative ABC transport system permease protein